MAIDVLAFDIGVEVISTLAEATGDLGGVTSKRIAVEAIGLAVAPPGPTDVLAKRLAVEVIGGIKEFAGTKVTAKRLVMEAISATGVQKRFLAWDNVPVNSFTLLARVTIPDWASHPGQLLLTDTEDHYVGVVGDAVSTRLVLASGSNSVRAPFTPAASSFILCITSNGTVSGTRMFVDATELTTTTSGGTFSTLNLSALNRFNLPAFLGAGSVSEVQLYDRVLSPTERDYLRAYFTCKWTTPGCDVNTDLPPAP